jgi:YD repeat-containing protein
MVQAFLHSSTARVVGLALCFLLLMSVTNRGQASNEIVYVYDELGRLVAVIDTASEAAVYKYDAVGNLLSISRYSAAQVSLVEFTPNGGPIGTTVTIYGTGFSTTASQNSVTFNGVAATVTSATTTKIVTTVPVGATTGLIGITTPQGSAVSSTQFVVGGAGAPTITDFSPTIGLAGTAVTVTGTNFDPAIANNKSKFNATISSVSSATATSLATTVPTVATSGHISISTPAGTAVSSNDFFVPPSPYTPSDVASTGRMAYGESKNLTFATANKIGLMVFDGVAGERASIKITNSTISSTAFTIYSPAGNALVTASISSGGGYLETPILTATGTHTILVDPSSTYTGNITFTLYGSNDLTGTIAINGAPVGLNIVTPGQNAKLTFSGTAGQRVSVGLSDMTWGVGYCCDVGFVSVTNPNGTVLLAPFGFGNGGGGTPSVVLPVTGTYTILLDPLIGRTGTITVTLSEDLTPAININGSAVNLTFRNGQNARLPFDGTAGQRVSVGVSDMTLATGYCCNIGAVTIYKPDGTVLLSPYEFNNGGAGTTSVVLPTSGTYAIGIDPYLHRSGNMTVTLSEDLGPAITINGSAVNLTYRTGQNARLPFDGTAGQRVSVGVSNMTLATGYCCNIGAVTIYKPDGTVLLNPYDFTNDGAGTPSVVLPTSGTYSIGIDPYLHRSGNQTVTLSADLTPSITINGPAVNLTFGVGQNARLPFDGTAGQRVSVGVSDMTLAPGYCCNIGSITIYKPDGTVLLNPNDFINSGTGTPSVVLPTTGTYSIGIDPYLHRSGNMTVTLSEDSTPALVVNDPAVTVQFNRIGLNAFASFSGTSGQQVTVRITNNLMGSVTVKLLKPDGTQLTAATSINSSFNLTTQTLSTTGTYKIVLDPGSVSTQSVGIRVTNP